MSAPDLFSAMAAAAKAGTLDALREAGLIGATAGEDYHRANPPPGLGWSVGGPDEDRVRAWRNAQDVYRAGRVVGSKVGRRLVIRRQAWADYVASCEKAPRSKPKPGDDPLDRISAKRAA